MSSSYIKLYDNETIDYLIALNHAATEHDITVAQANNFSPTWDSFSDIEILANFNDNLVSSYISGLSSELKGFVIYRQKIGESILHKVTEVDRNTISVIDFLISNRTEYQWVVVPSTEEEIGVSLVSDSISVDWGSWSITSLEQISKNVYIAGDVWLFSMGLGSSLQSSDIAQNIDVTEFKTFSQFPKISVGTSNYLSGSITCLLGNVNCTTYEYYDSIEMLNGWREFISKGKICLLKDVKGECRLVKLSESSSKYEDSFSLQPVTITFSFTEINSSDNISIWSPA